MGGRKSVCDYTYNATEFVPATIKREFPESGFSGHSYRL